MSEERPVGVRPARPSREEGRGGVVPRARGAGGSPVHRCRAHARVDSGSYAARRATAGTLGGVGAVARARKFECSHLLSLVFVASLIGVIPPLSLFLLRVACFPLRTAFRASG